jgi:hypothetical protein
MTGTALTLLLHAGLYATAQPPVVAETQTGAAARPDMVLQWNSLALQLIRVEKTPPPMAARNLAILHVAIYDAVNGIVRTHQPFYADATPNGAALPEAAAAGAGSTALAALYPAERATVDAYFRKCLGELPAGDATTRGLELGQLVAQRVVALRANDGAAGKGRHTVRPGRGAWQPTPAGYAQALFPGWGLVEPFAIRRGTQYRPFPPPALESEAYTKAFDEVKALGGKHSTARTDEQTQIALFWADNAGTVTPPGHWNQIAQGLARQRGTSLAENARLFALLNVSLADAGVLCWVIKFTHDFWRPVTAIRAAHDDGNPRTEPDPAWEPLLDTPAFPAYVSGHSTFSSAGAAALAKFFGTDKISFTTTSDALPGVTRRFDSLWAAAEEAGMSRIYGGIHWQFDNSEGLATGKTLGNYVSQNYFRPRPYTAARPNLNLPVIVNRP